MNQKDEEKPAPGNETGSENLPFVNEECGDTMWDVVIKEAEERLKGIVAPKNDGRGGNAGPLQVPTKQ